MHCPNCGTAAASEQKFCRACGFSLERIAQLLDEQSETSSEKTTAPRRGMTLAMASAAALTLTGLTLAIIDRLILRRGEVITGAGTLLFIWGAFLLAATLMWAEHRQKSGVSRRTPRSLSPEDTAKLPPESQSNPISGITERTTDLLELPVSRKRSGDLSG